MPTTSANAGRYPPGFGVTWLALTLGLVALIGADSWFLAQSLQRASAVSVVGACLAYAFVLRAATTPWLAGPLFALLVLLFHFGLAIYMALGLPFDPDLRVYLAQWLYGPRTILALYVSTLAIVAFAAAYGLAHGRPGVPRGAPEPQYDAFEEARDERFATIGRLLLVGGVAAYLGYVLVVAPQLLLAAGQYGAYNDALGGGDRFLSYAGLAVILGLIITAASPQSPARRRALLAFAVYAMLLLVLGVRTAVLFPAAAGVAAAAARGHKLPSGAKAVAVVLVGLTLVAGVREYRDLGANDQFNISALNPLDAIAETGGSLRPVVETVGWSEPHQHGGTYIAPLLRLGERVRGIPSPPVDYRLAGTLLQVKIPEYQLGYSAVAEAYYNFGRWGPGFIFVMIGALLGGLDRWRRPGIIPAYLVGLAMAGFGLTVRNTFISLPGTVLAGLALLLIVRVLAGHAAARHGRLDARRPNPRARQDEDLQLARTRRAAAARPIGR